MEFKFQADVVISKEFSIEAPKLAVAMDKAKEFWENSEHYWDDFKPSGVTFRVLNQDECIKWYKDKKRDE